MRLSVILTTYESPEWLEKVMWGYAGQSHRDFEVVVADDGSTEATARLARRLATESGLPLRHVWQSDRGFRKSRILNKAIVAAGADYLVFSDGDCIPRADFLAAHARLAAKGRFLSGGYVKLPMSISRSITRADVVSGRAFSARWLRGGGPGQDPNEGRAAESVPDAPVPAERRPAPPRPRGPSLRRLAKLAVPPSLGAAADLLTTTRATWNGHNASGWRRDLVAANGFDERMGYGGQDRELGERLENAGIRGRCIRHRALCVHLDHGRGYADLDVIRRNKAVRRHTRSARVTRTEHGIAELPAGAPQASRPRPASPTPGTHP